jgi:hypothetical protein
MLSSYIHSKYVSKIRLYVGFEVLTALVMESPVLWCITRSPLKVNRRIGETFHPHLQGIRNPRVIRSSETSVNKISTWRHIPEDDILQA